MLLILVLMWCSVSNIANIHFVLQTELAFVLSKGWSFYQGLFKDVPVYCLMVTLKCEVLYVFLWHFVNTMFAFLRERHTRTHSCRQTAQHFLKKDQNTYWLKHGCCLKSELPVQMCLNWPLREDGKFTLYLKIDASTKVKPNCLDRPLVAGCSIGVCVSRCNTDQGEESKYTFNKCFSKMGSVILGSSYQTDVFL